MRIKFFDRFLSAIVGLIVLFLGACLLIFGLGIFPFEINLSLLQGPFELWHRLIMVGVAVLLFLLGFHSLSLLFRRRWDKGFIMQNTELGDMSISMQAMENMVKRCIDTHEELKVSHTRIHRTRDGVAVDIRVSLSNGVNIPLTVNALQKQIKHYITSCSGVDVKEVRVMVETNNSQSPKSAELIAPDLLAADASVAVQAVHTPEGFVSSSFTVKPEMEPDREPIHQRIFKHEDQPQTVPPPPEAEAPAQASVEGKSAEKEMESVEVWLEEAQEIQADEPFADEPGLEAEALLAAELLSNDETENEGTGEHDEAEKENE